MSGHTPGPWTVGDVDNSIYVWQDGGKESFISEVSPEDVNEQEMVANARLIAAAPDLLAALIAYRDAKPQCECSSGSGCKMSAARDLAIAAIAKATHEPREVK
jgi:hypothetical protein